MLLSEMLVAIFTGVDRGVEGLDECDWLGVDCLFPAGLRGTEVSRFSTAVTVEGVNRHDARRPEVRSVRRDDNIERVC